VNTPINNLDLTKQPPHSPRKRLGGFVIAMRAVDKCRASLAGTLGAYHFDSRLDRFLFDFKGITVGQFQDAVQEAENYEGVGEWLRTHGTEKTTTEIKAWSDEMEASSPMKNPERREQFIENCHHVGLNPEMNTAFDWLEADDRTSFVRKSA
jgi:hypothetical protein